MTSDNILAAPKGDSLRLFCYHKGFYRSIEDAQTYGAIYECGSTDFGHTGMYDLVEVAIGVAKCLVGDPDAIVLCFEEYGDWYELDLDLLGLTDASPADKKCWDY